MAFPVTDICFCKFPDILLTQLLHLYQSCYNEPEQLLLLLQMRIIYFPDSLQLNLYALSSDIKLWEYVPHFLHTLHILKQNHNPVLRQIRHSDYLLFRTVLFSLQSNDKNNSFLLTYQC